MFEVVGALSNPGDPGRPNEDAWGRADAFVWVIDGATGLGDERLLNAPSDAAWLAAALGAALEAAAADAADPVALLTAAAAAVEARFVAERRRSPREHYEMPTAAVLVAHVTPSAIAIAELGDCAIYLAASDEVLRHGGTETGRAAERGGASRLMGGGGRWTAETLAYLRSVRNMANSPGGYAIFAPDATCATLARTHRQASPIGTALLVSDGYDAAVQGYGLFSESGLLAAASERLAGPLEALREVERADPDCTRSPRFKPSDDATAVLIRTIADG